MSNEQWLEVQHQVVALANVVTLMDLAGFVDQCDRALSFGVFADPTLWRARHEDLERIRELAAALLPFAKAVEKFRAGEELSACPR